MANLIGRVPPHNSEAETWVLGSIFFNKRGALAVLEMLKPDDFYSEGNGFIFAAILRLHAKGKPITTITVMDELGANLEGVGGLGYLEDVAGSVPMSRAARYYAEIVSEKARLRRLIYAGARMMEAAFDGNAEANTVHSDALAALAGIEPPTSFAEDGHPENLGPWYYTQLEDRCRKAAEPAYHLESGWYDLDQAMTIVRGNLVIVAARPSMGKTAWALQYAWNVAQYAPVLFFSLEMERDRLLDRLALGLTTIDGTRLERDRLTDTDFTEMADVTTQIAASGLNLYGARDLTVNTVRNRALKMTAEGHRPALIVIDYLGLMKMPKADRHDLAIGQVTRELKLLAGELGCAVMLLSQLNREVEKRPDKRPVLSDIKDSGSIEADADLVTFLYRDDYYARLEKRDSTKPDICEIIIAKYRNGCAKTVDLVFAPKKQTFKCPKLSSDWSLT